MRNDAATAYYIFLSCRCVARSSASVKAAGKADLTAGLVRRQIQPKLERG